jgi:anti-anti-sigma factor
MPERLSAHVRADFPVTVVHVSGRLDPTSAPVARAALNRCLAEQPDAIVVDLTGLSIVDEVDLTLFTGFARRVSDWPGAAVLICGASQAVAAGLDRMAVMSVLTVVPDLTVALQLARRRVAPLRLRVRLEPMVDAPARARALVVDACRRWGISHVIDQAEVIISELATNAVEHAHSAMEVAVVLREHYLDLSVWDRSHNMPVAGEMVAPEAGHGLGLVVVGAMASAWGSVSTDTGKIVWASLQVWPLDRS